MGLTENRMIIVDKGGSIHHFPMQTGIMHQECLDTYAATKGYPFSNMKHIVEQEKNAVFSNADNNMFVANMPMHLDEEQLNTLDRMALKMNEIDYMEVRKQGNETNIDYIFDNNVDDNFSRIFLQTYFDSSEKEGMGKGRI